MTVQAASSGWLGVEPFVEGNASRSRSAQEACAALTDAVRITRGGPERGRQETRRTGVPSLCAGIHLFWCGSVSPFCACLASELVSRGQNRPSKRV